MGCSNSSVSVYNEEGDLKRWNQSFFGIGLTKPDVDRFYGLFAKLHKMDPNANRSLRISTITNYIKINPNFFLIKMLSVMKPSNLHTGNIDDFHEFTLSMWNFGTLGMLSLAKFAYLLYYSKEHQAIDMKHIHMMLDDLFNEGDTRLPALKETVNAAIDYKNGFSEEEFIQFSTSKRSNINQFYESILKIQNKFQKIIFGDRIWNQFTDIRYSIEESFIWEVFHEINPHIYEGMDYHLDDHIKNSFHRKPSLQQHSERSHPSQAISTISSASNLNHDIYNGGHNFKQSNNNNQIATFSNRSLRFQSMSTSSQHPSRSFHDEEFSDIAHAGPSPSTAAPTRRHSKTQQPRGMPKGTSTSVSGGSPSAAGASDRGAERRLSRDARIGIGSFDNYGPSNGRNSPSQKDRQQRRPSANSGQSPSAAMTASTPTGGAARRRSSNFQNQNAIATANGSGGGSSSGNLDQNGISNSGNNNHLARKTSIGLSNESGNRLTGMGGNNIGTTTTINTATGAPLNTGAAAASSSNTGIAGQSSWSRRRLSDPTPVMASALSSSSIHSKNNNEGGGEDWPVPDVSRPRRRSVGDRFLNDALDELHQAKRNVAELSATVGNMTSKQKEVTLIQLGEQKRRRSLQGNTQVAPARAPSLGEAGQEVMLAAVGIQGNPRVKSTTTSSGLMSAAVPGAFNAVAVINTAAINNTGAPTSELSLRRTSRRKSSYRPTEEELESKADTVGTGDHHGGRRSSTVLGNTAVSATVSPMQIAQHAALIAAVEGPVMTAERRRSLISAPRPNTQTSDLPYGGGLGVGGGGRRQSSGYSDNVTDDQQIGGEGQGINGRPKSQALDLSMGISAASAAGTGQVKRTSINSRPTISINTYVAEEAGNFREPPQNMRERPVLDRRASLGITAEQTEFEQRMKAIEEELAEARQQRTPSKIQ